MTFAGRLLEDKPDDVDNEHDPEETIATSGRYTSPGTERRAGGCPRENSPTVSSR
jgi:hypothetical protein